MYNTFSRLKRKSLWSRLRDNDLKLLLWNSNHQSEYNRAGSYFSINEKNDRQGEYTAVPPFLFQCPYVWAFLHSLLGSSQTVETSEGKKDSSCWSHPPGQHRDKTGVSYQIWALNWTSNQNFGVKVKTKSNFCCVANKAYLVTESSVQVPLHYIYTTNGETDLTQVLPYNYNHNADLILYQTLQQNFMQHGLCGYWSVFTINIFHLLRGILTQ